jgi:polysaccharide export outer membrane protein
MFQGDFREFFTAVPAMLLAVLLILLSGCANRQELPAPVTIATHSFAAEPRPTAGADAKENLRQLVLGYGDKISIEVFNQENLQTTLTVDSSGVAILPLIGEVILHNRDVQSLRRELTERYAYYLKDPQIIIKIDSMVSQKYAVLGEVLQTGIFPLDMPFSISEVIAKAGGISSDGQDDAVLLVRRTETGSTVTRIDVASILQQGNFAADLQVKNGDIIYIPKKSLAITADFMGKVGTILNPIISLQRAITLWPAMVDALNNQEFGTSVILGN